ncbi:MAG: hypothetical protein A3H97_10415 [Acidobacteria bacterium RIFCSPLOWO2_02_FULL_65_29]|nr:MAG: hypothetical protein A3H97_10415 [Acidobacteria bacterium RIFCSPLOWO2_02_FULL_65_29]
MAKISLRTLRALRLIVVIIGLFEYALEHADRHGREGDGFLAAIDHRHAWTNEREHERSHSRAGDGHVHAHAPIGRLSSKLVRDRARRTEQPLEPPDVDRHQIVAMPLVARGEFLRNVYK